MALTIGPFEQATLLALIRLGERAYGRAILNEIEKRLERAVSAGAVYATLDRLQDKSLVSSRVAEGTAVRGGRARRYFTPTAAGIHALNHAKSAIDTLWRGFAGAAEGRV